MRKKPIEIDDLPVINAVKMSFTNVLNNKSRVIQLCLVIKGIKEVYFY